MNKILTVGHPCSGYRDVEHTLYSYGMSLAKASKRDGVSPVEIGSILRQAHGGMSSADVRNGNEIRQIETGPVWQGLALDLLMGNIDQKFWGWSDPEAIWLLEYWKALDPKMAFVLVYDEPHRVLTETVCDEASCYTRDIIEQRLDNWNAYNSALLGFYLRNRERCMLVNAKQVRRAADTCLNELKPYLDNQVLLSSHTLHNGKFRVVSEQNGVSSAEEALSEELSANALTVPALADGFLVENILAEYPEHLQRFEELQSLATIPLEESRHKPFTSLDAWLMQMKRRSETGRVMSILSEGKQRAEEQLLLKELQNETLREELMRAGKAKTDIQEQNEALQSQLQKVQEELNNTDKAKKDAEEEGKLLLSQLHQVNEELERYYLENEKNKKLGAEKAEVEKKFKRLEDDKKSLEYKLTDLQQQTGKMQEDVRVAGNAKREVEEENSLLLSQLHKVQEELERYYLENQKLKRELSPVYYGAADRLKSELPYQLGIEIIEHSRKVWPLLYLPILLSRTARQYREREAQQVETLPQLSEYRDYDEAEKAKKHLSYRLGEVWLKHHRTPWGMVAMPFALTKARREFLDYRKSMGK